MTTKMPRQIRRPTSPEASKRASRNAGSPDGRRALSGAAAERLQRECQDLFGLTTYEVRVLLALLHLGSANSVQVSRLAGVPRTSVYTAVEDLAAKGLAHPAPSDGPAVWSCPSRDEILERIDAAHQDRLRRYEAELDRYRSEAGEVREALVAAFAPVMAQALPYVRFVRAAAEVSRTYFRMLRDAQTDFVMFTRPPYTTQPGPAKAPVLEMVARGVTARVLYEAAHVDRPEFPVYHEAGVQGRVTDQLPMKLVVVDWRMALVVMTPPGSDADGAQSQYPTTLFVDHPGFAEILHDAFEARWRTSRPFPRQHPRRKQRQREATLPGATGPERR